MNDKQLYVYIMATDRNGTFYTGVSSDLPGRVWQHKNGTYDGFTKKYGIKMLVYYEGPHEATAAIQREKRVKKWTRAMKMQVIEAMNPEWNDLYDLVCN